MSALVLHVRLHDGRYHGEGDWPPSPARLFQALVAGAGLGGPLADDEQEAFRWLEEREAPIIAAPRAWRARRGVLCYMPNNDSDRIEGDPRRMATIRTATKVFRPYCFDAEVPFVYAWPIAPDACDEKCAPVICSLADRLYQLGRGVDMAWGWGEVLDDDRLDGLLAAHPGQVFRPSAGTSATTLLSPCPGSLESIERRYRAYGERFHHVKAGKAVKVVFRQPPRPRFRAVAYESPPSRALYELREPGGEAAFARWPLTRVSALVVRLRDGAVGRLKQALPARSAEIDRVLVGRRPDGTNDGPPQDRVRIIPLPSIGHVHADREIRRVLVEVPPSCPLRATDVHWAFSGLDVVDADTGKIQAVLIRSDDDGFLRHFGIAGESCHRVWRTVTPGAFPEDARRRRIDPARKREDAKAGNERVREQAHAAVSVRQALRHAAAASAIEAIRVQREPFEGRGARVEPFAEGTRFPKECLWHVEIRFVELVAGPLVIGNGRFLGLGVMAPVRTLQGVHVFAIEGGIMGNAEAGEVAHALRRAVMVRVGATVGNSETLPPFFSGHEPDGRPAKSEQHPHLAFVFDPDGSRLLVIAPHVIGRRTATQDEQRHLKTLERAMSGMCELTTRSAGLLRIHPTTVQFDTDPLFATSRNWESASPYRVTRHARGVTAKEAIESDLRTECQRRGLPSPQVVTLDYRSVPGVGLEGRVSLQFDVAVEGPLLLGKSRHMGGGLFRRSAGHKRCPERDTRP